MDTPRLVEHFFRHEYGKLTATLCRRVGAQYFDLVEDAAQQALLTGMESWAIGGAPDNPSAWLYKTASNKLIDEIRKHTGRDRILTLHKNELALNTDAELNASFVKEIQDDMIRMLFICCNEDVPMASQLVFALKSLCGFSIREIALRLFISEANVYKRFSRARNYLKNSAAEFDCLIPELYSSRLGAIHNVIYIVFTEGHLSVNHDIAIRKEMCDEAIRLATILADNPVGQVPETYALLALMYFHVARIAARQDASEGLLLLEDQDRSLWDAEKIHSGFEWLEKSAGGKVFSRYHAEASIAAEHCTAKSFTDTRWDRICDSYSLLEHVSPSPIHRLNRAVALAQWQGAAAGIAILNGFEPPSWLTGSYLWAAVLAYLYQENNDVEQALKYREYAFQLAPTAAIKQLIEQRLNR